MPTFSLIVYVSLIDLQKVLRIILASNFLTAQKVATMFGPLYYMLQEYCRNIIVTLPCNIAYSILQHYGSMINEERINLEDLGLIL